MSRTYALYLAAVLAFNAHADTLHLQLHGLSLHSAGTWNERNPGLGVRYQHTPDLGVQAGFYKNSMSTQTVYAVAQWTPLHVGPLSAGAFAGVATRYTLPVVVGALATVQGKRWSATVRAVPKTRHNPAVATFEIGYRYVP